MSNRTLHFDMAVPSREAPRVHARAKAASYHKGVSGFLRARAGKKNRSRALALPFSPVALALALAISLAVAYIALVATVMSYASMTVSFSQSVRDSEAQVAALEAEYLSAVSSVTATDYVALGYAKPANKTFVRQAPRAALR